MLDFLTIFTKGGLVLWCFDATANFKPIVNQFINDVFLQSKFLGSSKYRMDSRDIKCLMDNEYNLVFVVAYQNIVQLAYVDKLLTEIQLRFRDKYKNQLTLELYDQAFDFKCDFYEIYNGLKDEDRQNSINKQFKAPRKWEDTAKAKKTVASLLKKPNDKDISKSKGCDNKIENPELSKTVVSTADAGVPKIIPPSRLAASKKMRSFNIAAGGKKKPVQTDDNVKRIKKATKWDESVDPSTLDYSNSCSENRECNNIDVCSNIQSKAIDLNLVGQCIGDLKDIDEAEVKIDFNASNGSSISSHRDKTPSTSNFLSSFTSMLAGKPITAETLKPALNKIQEHLLSRNVASEVCGRLCDAVEQSLIGQTLNTFQSLNGCVRQAMTDIVLQILSPDRQLNILRDALNAKQNKRTFVIVFCGVNGVGKSTSLAKIAFWFIENGLSVMIAACDTFRSGAVEQLQTHVRHLNSLHPSTDQSEMVTLFQKGYGGDAATLCFDAINKAKASMKDVVLVDTAGRMQDNEPLMRALTKLIHLNQPDLVLFVGEALVGNEAVDQARKFNQSLSDFTAAQQKPRLIDGIVLTKFDTVDDKVGAAVSMCYTTAKPIVFVGTGQTYSDIRKLNVTSIVNALLK